MQHIDFAQTSNKPEPSAHTHRRTVRECGITLGDYLYSADFLQLLEGQEVAVAYCALSGVVAIIQNGQFLGNAYRVHPTIIKL